MLGTIATCFREPHRPSERQVRLVELYARQAADFVEAARLHRDLREADRRKDEFLAMLAHELRNPLAAILGEAQVLGDEGCDGPALAESREVILRQGRQMTRLVDDLLDASRIRRGDIPLRKVPVEVATEVARAVEAARPLIERARPRAHGVAPPRAALAGGRPGPARPGPGQPPDQRRQVHRAGGPDRPGGRARGRRPGRPGAGQRHRDRSGGPAQGLRPLRPGGRDRGSVAGGLGIGLALVRSLVERHGGSVSATSAGPGRGSEFVVSLPLAASPAEERGASGRLSTERRTPRANRDRGGCSSWTTSPTRRGAWPGS